MYLICIGGYQRVSKLGYRIRVRNEFSSWKEQVQNHDQFLLKSIGFSSEIIRMSVMSSVNMQKLCASHYIVNFCYLIVSLAISLDFGN